MSKHDEKYRVLIIIAIVSGCMCIIIAGFGILYYSCDSSISYCMRSEIKNINTMHNVIPRKENTF
jgi:hypothetical protein